MKRQHVEVNAVLDRDLKRILEGLGVKGSDLADSVVCSECGKQISFDNIGAIRVLDGQQPSIICDDYGCLLDLNYET
jgi:hypothetical protein